MGCYNHTPLKESRPEIQNERLSREEKQINPQRQQEKVTLEKVNVDGMIGCRYGLRTYRKIKKQGVRNTTSPLNFVQLVTCPTLRVLGPLVPTVMA